MTGKKEGDRWRHTSVILREDICRKAHERGIDISDACNRTLADLVGIDYRQQQIDGRSMPKPVIIAADSTSAGAKATEKTMQSPALPPVINADDPAAIVKVIRAKRQPSVRPAPDSTVPVSSPPAEKESPSPAAAPEAPQVRKGRKNAPVKKIKESGLKKFVASKITRIDTGNAAIPKDDMYQSFVRWCRDHRITPIPDRKAFSVSLKNQFAITEKRIDGVPCWVNIRLD